MQCVTCLLEIPEDSLQRCPLCVEMCYHVECLHDQARLQADPFRPIVCASCRRYCYTGLADCWDPVENHFCQDALHRRREDASTIKDAVKSAYARLMIAGNWRAVNLAICIVGDDHIQQLIRRNQPNLLDRAIVHLVDTYPEEMRTRRRDIVWSIFRATMFICGIAFIVQFIL